MSATRTQAGGSLTLQYGMCESRWGVGRPFKQLERSAQQIWRSRLGESEPAYARSLRSCWGEWFRSKIGLRLNIMAEIWVRPEFGKA
jgi:hypothetical protein